MMSRDLDDAVYPIWYFDYDSTNIIEGVMTVVSGKVQEQDVWGTIVSLRYPGISADIYQVQQLTLDEDGLVELWHSNTQPTVPESVSLQRISHRLQQLCRGILMPYPDTTHLDATTTETIRFARTTRKTALKSG